jgi:hypothetical protein
LTWITRTINNEGKHITFSVNKELKKVFHVCCAKNGTTFSEVIRQRIEKFAREKLSKAIIDSIENESE